MTRYAVIKYVGDKTIAAFQCEDMFIFTGKLKDCPEYIVDLVEADNAVVYDGKLKIYNGVVYMVCHPGDLIINYDGRYFQRIAKQHLMEK